MTDTRVPYFEGFKKDKFMLATKIILNMLFKYIKYYHFFFEILYSRIIKRQNTVFLSARTSHLKKH